MKNQGENFSPQENQIRFLRIMHKSDFLITIKAACEKAEISREAYYKWFEDTDGFAKWYIAEAEKWLAAKLISVKSTVMKAALGGDKINNYQDRRLAIELMDKDFAVKKHNKIEIENKNAVNIDNDLLTKLDSIIEEK
jgi:hypothetical protein